MKNRLLTRGTWPLLAALVVICIVSWCQYWISRTTHSGRGALLTDILSSKGDDDGVYAEPDDRHGFHDTSALRINDVSAPLQGGCLDSWISQGNLNGCNSDELSGISSLLKNSYDVVWTWVNGSDPAHQALRSRYLCGDLREQIADLRGGNAEPADDGSSDRPIRCKLLGSQNAGSGDVRYRERGELKYSIRSAYSYLGNARKFDVLVDDYAPRDSKHLSQIPQWFNESYVRPGNGATLEFIGHSQLFSNERHLPSFSSVAIESQLPNLQNLTSHYLYMNDDYFIGHQMNAADIWNPLNGPVLRLLYSLNVDYALEQSAKQSPAGEWRALIYSNYLLSERFGKRLRPYVSHSPKVLSKDVMSQIQAIWTKELQITASHKFRTQGNNVHISWMATHYLIERHREILLWSLIFFRADADGDGQLSPAEYEAFVATLQPTENRFGDQAKVPVQAPRRQSLEQLISRLVDIPWDVPLQNAYLFLSQDGYAYPQAHSPGHFDFQTRVPSFTGQQQDLVACTISITQCFPTNVTELLFRHIAFQEPSCGDCIITAALGRATTGLEAFLPSEDATFPSSYPNVGSWKFSPLDKSYNTSLLPFLDSKYTLRENVERLIQRFSYSVALAPIMWAPVASPSASQIAPLLAGVEASHPAFYIIQDEQTVPQPNEVPQASGRGPLSPETSSTSAHGSVHGYVNDHLAQFWERMHPERPVWELSV